MSDRVVIVGASVGGVRTAQALRRNGSEAKITLVGEEIDLPYDKPPLSKQFLAGEWAQDRVTLLSREAAEEARIELRLGVAAQRLDVAGRVLHLADGSTLDYDAVVLATGAHARPSPWQVESGVHVLRSMADSQAMAQDLREQKQIVVVGGGFIGAEAAATAAGYGAQVTVVDPMRAPISRVVGAEMGELISGVHERHGVATRFGVGVEAISGRRGDLTVQLTDGRTLSAGAVIVGIGAIPNDGWLADSGLLIEDGVVCDEFCRAVDADNVFAVGDVARWFHPGHDLRCRVEHWTNAVDQAATVAHNITHPQDLHAYQPVEYVWSDQYDWKIQIVGRPALGTRTRVVSAAGHGPKDSDRPRVAAVSAAEAGRLLGAVVLNWPKALLATRKLMAAGASYDEAVERLTELAEAMPPAPAVAER